MSRLLLLMASSVFNSLWEKKITWKREKSAVPEKNEEVWKAAGNLITQIIKDLNVEGARKEELIREEKMKDSKKIKLKNGLNIR